MTRRDLAAVAGIAVAAALLFGGDRVARLDGLGIDCLFWLRQELAPAARAPAEAPVAVIAIDEETYRQPPFKDTPQVMWTPQQAKVLDAVLDAGATVVGFDVIYSTSVESYIPGFERDFLRSLRRGASDGRIVLSKAQHQEQPIEPFRGIKLAAGVDNVRSINLLEDPDGVVRRMPLFLEVGAPGELATQEPTFAFELAARARHVIPRREANGSVRLGDTLVRTDEPNAVGVNFDTRPGAVPTYSFADLAACAGAGTAEYFRQHFAGRIVLVGTMLDVEDRKLTSARFATHPEGQNAPERCAVPVMPGLVRADLRRDTIPGVLIHAAAISNLLRGDGLMPVPWTARAALLLVLAAATGLAVMRLRLSLAAAGAAALLAIWTAGSIVAFSETQVLPLLSGTAAMVVAFGASLAYRFGLPTATAAASPGPSPFICRRRWSSAWSRPTWRRSSAARRARSRSCSPTSRASRASPNISIPGSS